MNRKNRSLFAAAWVLALCLLTGCGRSGQEGGPPREETGNALRVALAAYQYDQGYMLAEGWMYDMLITSQPQVREAEELVDAVTFRMTDGEFEMNTGYRMTFMDAAGQVTRDVLILTDGTASMEGSVFEMENAEPLVRWLEALRLAEQTLE